MPNSDWSDSTVLAEWAERECRHLDLIASWETLLSIYETLGFTGPDNDDMRLSEFKMVIQELNKFLTRMKNGLANTHGIVESINFLASHSNTADVNGIRTRSSVAYNKMKQQWIMMAIFALQTRAELSVAQEGESDD